MQHSPRPAHRALDRLAGVLVALCLLATPAQAQEARQIKLSETHVKNFIAAQKDLAAVSAKMQDAGDNPDEKLRAELDQVAKKHGFKDGNELRDVDYSIIIVMDGIDPATGEFFDPLEALKAELEEIKADKEIPEKEKAELIKEREEAIQFTPPLEHKENVELVKKHRDEIEKALQ